MYRIARTQKFIPVILVKKGSYGNESLGLAWDHMGSLQDRIKVFKII